MFTERLNKKILSPEKHQNKTLLYALCINIAFAIFVLLFFYNNYETNDDQLMLMFLTGSFSGTGTHYLMYVNSILAFPLQQLYAAIPSIPWYPIFQYITVLLSFTAITYVLLKKDLKRGLILTVLLLFTFGFDIYTQMQFTKVSGCSTAAGVLLGLHAAFNSEKSNLRSILASILICIGSCFRFKMSLIVILFFAPVFAFVWYKQVKEKLYKKLLCGFTWIFVTILICFSLYGANAAIYNRNPKWSNYMDFNSYRSQLLDRSFPNYAENEELYTSMELSQADINLYRTWDFGDPELFTHENVKKMSDARVNPTVDGHFIKSFIKEVPLGYLEYPWIAALLVTLALIIYASSKNIVWLLFQLGILLGFSLYLFYYERYLKNRVDICIFLASTVALMYIYLETNKKEFPLDRKTCILSLALVLLACSPSWGHYVKSNLNVETQCRQHRVIADEISKDVSHLYLVSLMSSDIWRDAYGIFEPIKPSTMSNICFFGGCFAFTPEWDMTLDRWGIENPYSDCINNEKIYILDNKHINSIVAYINRHYDNNAKAVPVDMIDDCLIHQIVSNSP